MIASIPTYQSLKHFGKRFIKIYYNNNIQGG